MDSILAYEAVAIFVNRLIMFPVCVESDKMPPHHHHYVAVYMLTWDFFKFLSHILLMTCCTGYSKIALHPLITCKFVPGSRFLHLTPQLTNEKKTFIHKRVA